MTKLKVLIVDDHPLILETVVSLLEPAFDILGTFIDGQAAIEAAVKLQPDLVVLDISMPGLSGLDVARELRKRAMKTKIVFLTIHDDPAMVSLAQEVGGNGYVVKNHIATDLIPAIEEATKPDCQVHVRE